MTAVPGRDPTRTDPESTSRPARRSPRADPRPGRPGQQPQEHQRRDPEAPADRVHRRLGLGQELARVRHDRRRVAAPDQRDVQRLRPGLHAHAGPAGRRRAGWADDRDHRRPAADGRQRSIDGGHRDRRQRDAADPVQPARTAPYRLSPGLLVQHSVGPRGRLDHGREDRREGREEDLLDHRRDVPPLRGDGDGLRDRPRRAVRRDEVTGRRRDHGPGLYRRGLELPPLRVVRLR